MHDGTTSPGTGATFSVALEVRDLVKSFPGTRALDGVSLAFRRGEIHGIIGENGAGKSTLMKILAGVQPPDSGEVFIDGVCVHLRSVRDALDRGVAMIHQELNLVGDLSAAENIALGREPNRFGFVARRTMLRDARAALSEVGATFSPSLRVNDLSIAAQQLVEIAKALACDARFLIMDEPTAVLSERETTALFALIKRLAARGVTIAYISHLLPEVLALSNRISVLRDGKLVSTVIPSDVDESRLAGLMVGRALADIFPPRAAPPRASPLLEIRNLRVGAAVRDVSFTVASGEIVGLAGLVGSGRTETAEAIVGLRPRDSGTILLSGKAVRFRGPRAALEAGIAYVSEDRKARGVHLAMSCVENVTIPHLKAFGRVFPDRRRERATADTWIARLAIRCPNPRAPIRTLSGGNQQKFAVAKWLDALPKDRPRVILLDEPTRGIDLGAKLQMYRLIADLAAQGLACVLISSELPELIGLCHRIVVLRAGEVAGTVDGDSATEESVMRLAAGVGTRRVGNEFGRTG
ncbi:MAG: sugar ABC transporter ATP-binding protein [Phycisphaerae bacterium]|nr:sugar ABC transporter ATP-binding protein [Phycisphaerae bacterium]